MAKTPFDLTQMNAEEVASDDLLIIEDVDKPKTKAITVAELERRISNRNYPVGTIYTNELDSTNPTELLGMPWSTWAKIEDRFIYAQGGKAAGETGGSETETLTTAQLASHTHSNGTLTAASAGSHTHPLGGWAHTAGSSYSHANGAGSHNFSNQTTSTNSAGAHTHNVTGVTSATGSGEAHNNMPPYLVAYMWRRIA